VERQRTPPRSARRNRNSGADTGEDLAHAFSDIELLVAADVIKSSISEGRKHLDLEALRSVLAKLTAAHNWKKRTAP
jgi:hypothetical protein